MDGITELAKHIRARDNPSPYTPMFGKIISLPELKIQLGNKIILTAEDVKATFDIYETRIMTVTRNISISINMLSFYRIPIITSS
jgi:hypothetical protein